MNICWNNHDEIVHDVRNCPLCEAFDEIADLKSKVKDLEDEVSSLEGDG